VIGDTGHEALRPELALGLLGLVALFFLCSLLEVDGGGRADRAGSDMHRRAGAATATNAGAAATALAARAAGTSHLPVSIAAVASVAHTGRSACWMEQGVLVEGSAASRVLPAEDVAAATAVVTAGQEAEASIAVTGVAGDGGRVGLGMQR
jgi:hypothetical protein